MVSIVDVLAIFAEAQYLGSARAERLRFARVLRERDRVFRAPEVSPPAGRAPVMPAPLALTTVTCPACGRSGERRQGIRHRVFHAGSAGRSYCAVALSVER